MTFLKTEIDRQIAAHREARKLFDVRGRSARELAKERARRLQQTPSPPSGSPKPMVPDSLVAA